MHHTSAQRGVTKQPMVCRSGGGGGASEKGLTTGFRGINAICDRLALVKIIRDRACEVFKKVC
jgi:hypothetical protein